MELASSTDVAGAAAALAANVQTSLSSVWTLLLIAVSIPLAFYIAHRVMGLFPGRRGR